MTKKQVMFEILKFSFKNKSTNISISNHISNDEDHAWHPQRHYKQVRLVCFHGKIYVKKKITLPSSKINVNKVCIATQLDIKLLFLGSSSTSCPNQSVYHFGDVVFYVLNLQYKLHPSNLLIEPTKN
jgi:RAB protein geranylgeranyltransferase component A